ncbi:hypothetical protein ACPPVV_11690 [Rhodanobacter sp. Col0626]|uniref:hypothetical protein n=1 Tax=Rhodanobacter sp. Col0626 TaxID=3415679 RepID=UPI003CEF9AEA
MTAATITVPKRNLFVGAGAVGRAPRDAIVTMLATLACTMAIAPEPGPAVLAIVLCLSLSRSHLDRDLRG